MDIVLLLVVNCKFDIIIDRIQQKNIYISEELKTRPNCTAQVLLYFFEENEFFIIYMLVFMDDLTF